MAVLLIDHLRHTKEVAFRAIGLWRLGKYLLVESKAIVNDRIVAQDAALGNHGEHRGNIVGIETIERLDLGKNVI